MPHAVRGGAIAVDKSSAYRLEPGIPLVVPEVNGGRALEHDGIVANPNCCTIPLTCVLKPLHDAAGLARVRVSTYQSVSGAGAQRMERLLAEPQDEHDLAHGLGAGTATRPTRSRSSAPRRARSWSCPSCRSAPRRVRVPVLVGHAEAVWIETRAAALAGAGARELLGAAPSVRARRRPDAGRRRQTDDVLVGRIRPDRAGENGLALFLACDNLNKGAALNAIQIAELLLGPRRAAA